jgi:molybdate transport system substrate-binding protein
MLLGLDVDKQRGRLLSGILVAIILTAVSFGTTLAQAGQEITVSAAISLKNAFTDLGKLYKEGHPGIKVSFNFGACGDLAKQIMGGAPVAVFASADQKDMNEVEKADLLAPGSRADLAGNEVVLVHPKTTTVKLSSFADLTKPEIKKIAIGNPKTVPAGRYAMEVLNLSNSPMPLETNSCWRKMSGRYWIMWPGGKWMPVSSIKPMP